MRFSDFDMSSYLRVLGGDLLEVVHGGPDVVGAHEQRVELLRKEKRHVGACTLRSWIVSPGTGYTI